MTLALDDKMHANGGEPLAIPATLRIRMLWRSRELVYMFGSLFALFQVGVILLIPLRNRIAWPFPVATLFAEGLLMAFLAPFYFLMCIGWNERLRVTDEGIWRQRFFLWRTVRWDEARLFALVGEDRYELASQRGIVQWSRPSQGGSVQPTIPFDEYQRQIDGLLLLVRERTGLPLSAMLRERS